jgi:RNA polymerase sigma factor (sigma-70 family)
MAETSISLLERLRREPSAEEWQRLVQIYTPLIRHWLGRYALAEADRDDLAQDVMAVVVRRLPEFEHNQRHGAFRHWLRMIVTHRLRDFWRAQRSRPQSAGGSDFLRLVEELEDPASGLSRLWEQEHDRHVVEKVLEQIESDFEATTWKAFQRVARDGSRPADVAAELGISVNAVLLAKSRVLRRLRRECRGLAE